jgi:hypothetical protein
MDTRAPKSNLTQSERLAIVETRISDMLVPGLHALAETTGRIESKLDAVGLAASSAVADASIASAAASKAVTHAEKAVTGAEHAVEIATANFDINHQAIQHVEATLKAGGLNGDTVKLKLVAQRLGDPIIIDGLVAVAKTLPPMLPDLQSIVERHKEKLGFWKTLNRLTAWGMTREIIVFAIGGGVVAILSQLVHW